MRTCGLRDVPCHRVVAAAGKLGGFGGNLEMKRGLLRAEGVVVIGSSIRDFRSRRWPSRPAGVMRRDGPTEDCRKLNRRHLR